ncbi:MAG: hypothetical protein K2X77_11950 [Candidatus Obscuribacterales bacterium]|jgi:hypothetical protein|nr:hypothetical protein [Candidatus Obscuribacterales bacterium]
MKYPLNKRIQLATGSITISISLTACGQIPEELKTFNGYDVSREICDDVKVKLPKKSTHGTMNCIHDKETTQADLKPGEVRVVLKRDGKNFGMNNYNGMFSGGVIQGPNRYAAYERATDESNPTAALIQSRQEILKYLGGKQLSEHPIMMNGQFPGVEVDFEGKEADSLGKLRIYFVQNSASRSGEARPRLYGVQAIGSKDFLASEQTKEVLDSLTIKTK